MADFPNSWMWSEACDMLARAERLHREFFQPVRSGLRTPSWEPPVDIIETERDVLVLVALPGVDPDRVRTLVPVILANSAVTIGMMRGRA